MINCCLQFWHFLVSGDIIFILRCLFILRHLLLITLFAVDDFWSFRRIRGFEFVGAAAGRMMEMFCRVWISCIIANALPMPKCNRISHLEFLEVPSIRTFPRKRQAELE